MKVEYNKEAMRNWITEHWYLSDNEKAEKYYKETGVSFSATFFRRNRIQWGIPPCGKTGYFQKGVSPPNKGRKIETWMSIEGRERLKATQFKKGDMPHNHLPVGTEVAYTDGYRYVKVAEPAEWVLKQRLLYEKYHGEKLKSNEIIVFLDRNTNNFSEENLFKLTRQEHLQMNKNHLIKADRDLTQVGLDTVKLDFEIKRRKGK